MHAFFATDTKNRLREALQENEENEESWPYSHFYSDYALWKRPVEKKSAGSGFCWEVSFAQKRRVAGAGSTRASKLLIIVTDKAPNSLPELGY